MVIQGDGLAMGFVVLVDVRQEGQQGWMRAPLEDDVEDVCRELLETVASGFLDLGLGIAGEYEEDGGEFNRFEGQRATGSHFSRFDGRVGTGVFLGLGRELELDLAARARGVF